MNRLKSEGINIIIALGHSGFEIDRIIAQEVEHVDLVIGGHSNTFLYSGNIFNLVNLFWFLFIYYCIALSHAFSVSLKVIFNSKLKMYRQIGNSPDAEKPTGPYPFWEVHTKSKKKVPVVQASHITKYLGKLFIEFNDEGEVINSYGNPILLDSSIEQGIYILNLMTFNGSVQFIMFISEQIINIKYL